MDLFALADLCTPWCLHVAATLRVAQHIASGTTDIAGLAAAAKADPDALHRVLRHLSNKGVFSEGAPGQFALTALGEGLLHEGVLVGLDLDSFGGRMAHAWCTLLPAVRTGQPAYSDLFGRPFWQDLETHPAVAADFDALMGPAGHGTPDPDLLEDAALWQDIHTVVDVGGGTGALLVEILRAHPHLRGTLVEQPATIDRARPYLEAAHLSPRIAFAPQSFFDPLPSGAGLYVLKSVLSDWPDPEASAILRCCAEAAYPGGRVVVFTNAGPGDAQAPPDLLMLILVGGKGRTFTQLCTLATQAGLRFEACHRQSGGRFVLLFRP